MLKNGDILNLETLTMYIKIDGIPACSKTKVEIIKANTNVPAIIEREISIESMIKLMQSIEPANKQEPLEDEAPQDELVPPSDIRKNILNAENSIIDTVKSGKNAAEPLLTSKEFLEQTGNSETYKQLTDDQKNALKFILTSTDSFMAIQGDAGSGKTTMFKEFGQVLAEAQALSSDKTEIIAMAPTGKAASVMFKEAGLESQTIDSFLLKPSRNSDDVKKSTLYIVDEASMISTLKLEALLSRAEQENARVVLTGDIKQLPPIEQGSMFAKLQIDQTIPAVEMTQVLRQKTEITQSYAYNFKSGNIEEAFDTLASQGRIIEHSDKIELRSAIISKAVSDIQEFGLESVAVLSNSNQMKSYINQGIRNELITSGYLENTEALTVKALEAKQLAIWFSLDSPRCHARTAGTVLVTGLGLATCW
jgi:ATP-dependent exoDNAse (exonuclease V) alpha subunit